MANVVQEALVSDAFDGAQIAVEVGSRERKRGGYEENRSECEPTEHARRNGHPLRTIPRRQREKLRTARALAAECVTRR
jgi:hypothetical protein